MPTRSSGRVEMLDDHYDCLDKADAPRIYTEWSVFRRPDFDELKKRLNAGKIFDGRNLYGPKRVAKRGFTYYAIGRGTALPVDPQPGPRVTLFGRTQGHELFDPLENPTRGA